MRDRPAEITATGMVVVSITFLSIVFGELVPKRLGLQYPETIARLVARPMEWLLGDHPAVRQAALLVHRGGAQAARRARRARPQRHRGGNRRQPRGGARCRRDREAGAPDGAQRLSPRRPPGRLDDDPARRDRLARGRRRRRPTCCGPSPRPSTRAIRSAAAASTTCSASSAPSRCCSSRSRASRFELEAHLQSPVFVPETLSGMELLEQFRASSAQLVFVVDEYGEVQGMITVRDVLEAITGEFSTAAESDSWAVRAARRQLAVRRPDPDARAEGPARPQGAARGGPRPLQHARRDDHAAARPAARDRRFVEWEGWRFEVVDLDGKRVDKVLAQALVPDSTGAHI